MMYDGIVPRCKIRDKYIYIICFESLFGIVRNTTAALWKSARSLHLVLSFFFSSWKHMFTFSCGSLAPRDNDFSTRAEQPSRATVFS